MVEHPDLKRARVEDNDQVIISIRWLQEAVESHGKMWLSDYITFLDLNSKTDMADENMENILNNPPRALFEEWLEYVSATIDNIKHEPQEVWTEGLTDKEVTTITLEWFPSGSDRSLHELYKFARDNKINVLLEGEVKGTGGYPIKLNGPEAHVYAVVKENWCANEVSGSYSEHLYIMGLLGNAEAMEEWSKQ